MFKPTIHHSKVANIHHKHKFNLPFLNNSRQSNNNVNTSNTYYWIWAEENGRRIVWGPYNTNAEAQRKGYSKLHSYFEVVPLNTKDEGEASKRLRAKLLDETGNISESFQRFQHKEQD